MESRLVATAIRTTLLDPESCEAYFLKLIMYGCVLGRILSKLAVSCKRAAKTDKTSVATTQSAITTNRLLKINRSITDPELGSNAPPFDAVSSAPTLEHFIVARPRRWRWANGSKLLLLRLR